MSSSCRARDEPGRTTVSKQTRDANRLICSLAAGGYYGRRGLPNVRKDQLVGDGLGHRVRPVQAVELVLRTLQMDAHHAFRNAEDGCDILAGLAHRAPRQAFAF